MSKVFVIADLHLGHEKAALARGFLTPLRHDIALMDNWNSVVGKRDSVFVLGDVAFGLTNMSILNRMNGTKKLVMGNHDKYPIANYLQYFSQVFGCVKYKECILSHIPVHTCQLERFKYNVHGHLHSKNVPVAEVDYYGEPDDKRYICVSAEQTNLTPVLFSSLIGEYYPE